MRSIFTVVAALGVAAAVFASTAFAQTPSFPSPNFRGGNTDWTVVLETQTDLTVRYSLKVPEARGILTGKLAQAKAPNSQYELNGVIGAEKAALKVKIAPVKLGDVCKDNKGSSTGPYGPYTYAILVYPAQSKPAATGQHKAWPKLWYGCGDFNAD